MHFITVLTRTLLTGLLLSPIASNLQAAETTDQPTNSLEPKALDVLKAMSDRLSAANSMSFEAIAMYEQPSRLGPVLAYNTRAEVSLKRPNMLRVLSQGDGPKTQFFYNGQRMQAYAPAENLLASSPAPADLQAMLKEAYQKADIYFPFTDLIVADPYQDLLEDMRLAFYIGQSSSIGDTTTDIIAYANDQVFVQAWIGRDDHLPRMLRATFKDDPLQLRHQLTLRNWQLNPKLDPENFTPHLTAVPQQINFASPRLPRPRQTSQSNSASPAKP